YAPAQLVRDAQAHGIAVHPIDINCSDWDCTLEPKCGARRAERETPFSSISAARSALRALRLGFRLLKGLPQAAARAIILGRRKGHYRSIADLCRRTRTSRPLLARLAAADAFGLLCLPRRFALWLV